MDTIYIYIYIILLIYTIYWTFLHDYGLFLFIIICMLSVYLMYKYIDEKIIYFENLVDDKIKYITNIGSLTKKINFDH